MIILGIDPGTLITGFGVLEVERDTLRLLAYDVVKNKPVKSMPLRLKAIYAGLTDIIESYHPDECAIETAFYGKNAQSALKIGQARGVAILASVLREVPIAEYSPREVKQAVTGNGGASKDRVQYMVRSLLRIDSPPKELDATDAVAVALCHLRHKGRVVPASRGRKHTWEQYLRSNPEKVKTVR
jgi:crossover junction endodeoxyribonuclease RuvC